MSESHPEWFETVNAIIVDHEMRLARVEECCPEAIAKQMADMERRLAHLESLIHRYINEGEDSE